MPDGTTAFERKIVRLAPAVHVAERDDGSEIIKMIADTFPLTDLGNAERLSSLHGKDLRYCESHGWLVWAGTHWKRDETGEVYRRATATIRAMQANAVQLEDDRRAKLLAWGAKGESRHAIESAVALSRTLPGIAIAAGELDKEPLKFNVANGTIDLRTGKCEAANRFDLLTKVSPVAHDPKADCPTFITFLNRIFDGREDLIGFVQRAAGYSLTGQTTERALFLLYGGGANGKSTLLDVFRHVFGDYAIHSRPDVILSKRGDSIPCDVARLAGSRFVTITEIEDGRRMDIAAVKEMAGGSDPITARFMRQNEFTFVPNFKLWIACNHRPVVRDQTESIWDRIRLIPFDVRIDEAERDPNLPAKLKAEASGILNWMLAGCLAWQRDGLQTPDCVRAATQQYRSDSDSFALWRDERTELDARASERAGNLYANYKSYCELSGERPISLTSFGKRLQDDGYERIETNYVAYKGLRMREL